MAKSSIKTCESGLSGDKDIIVAYDAVALVVGMEPETGTPRCRAHPIPPAINTSPIAHLSHALNQSTATQPARKSHHF